VVTLKNNGYGGALLHSHPHLFPDGSKQQQVTAYAHKDSNNDWVIQKHYVGPWENNGTLEYVKDGDMVALIHQATGRKLHSHRIPAPLSKLNYEVSCYGDETVGDLNDMWKVEVVEDLVAPTDKVRILTTRFKLRHPQAGCVLRSDANNLPQWGYKQQEVSCDYRNENSENHIWNVENHVNDKSKLNCLLDWSKITRHCQWTAVRSSATRQAFCAISCISTSP
jgi:dolichyl-phosphate-mannose-protein mannosyltransferase